MKKEVFAFIILIALCSCLLNNSMLYGDILGTKEDKHFVQINGTVSISFSGIGQGPSYIINADDGKIYMPESMPQSYEHGGAKVYVEGWVPKRIFPFGAEEIPLNITKIERVKDK